ncbi:MAG: hypothetical protein R2867_33420 [Caldilineaceae bacterium]
MTLASLGYSRNDDGVYGHSTNEYGVMRAESGAKAAVFALLWQWRHQLWG